MNEDIELFDIQQVVEGLKEGQIYWSKTPQMTYFILRNGKVLVSASSIRYSLSLEEFVDLYKKSVFALFDPNQVNEIDEEKDKEYYSWTHK